MNFSFTWLFDKLGYMPKIDLEIGKVKIDTQSTEFKMWPFPIPEEKEKPVVKKVITRKLVSKKATKVVKKAK
jgi:hypothetical protein